MAGSITQTRARFDRLGVLLSGLCAVHCILSVVVVAGLGLGGGILLAPEIHRYGLALAVIVAAATIGLGAFHHRRGLPLLVALFGLGFMGAALFVGHGVEEAALTVAGVALVAVGHLLNIRHNRGSNLPRA